ncbi:MAG: glycosyltransferase [Smithellaceae bacterium]
MISELRSSKPSINILHLVGNTGNTSGGLGPVVKGLLKNQQLYGCNPVVWSLDQIINEDRIKNFNTFSISKIGYSPYMEKHAISKDGAMFHIIHQHSIWMAISRVTRIWRKYYSRPTVISPHGTLERIALEKSSFKKRLALLAYERDNLNEASCLHATAVSEAISLRKFGLINPIAVIPNAISEEWLDTIGNPERFRSRYSIPDNKRIMMFFSRINPIKGLPLLFNAMKDIKNELEEWCLIIAGFEDVKGYKRKLENMAKKLDISKKIIFTGALFGVDKADAFAAAELFVLPTHSENFGIVVIEALASGLPVITTYGAPWEELQTYRCGWWVEISEQGIYNALIDAIIKPKNELSEMGARGRILVESKYTWRQISSKSIELYCWLLGMRDKPEFII